MPKATKATINRKAPEGWYLAGSHPFEYEATLDTEEFYSGTRSCRVDCIVKKHLAGLP